MAQSVWVVDDEPLIRTAMIAVLTELGYETRGYGNAEDLYAESAIRAGRHADVLGELHRLVALQPTRERRWGLLPRIENADVRAVTRIPSI